MHARAAAFARQYRGLSLHDAVSRVLGKDKPANTSFDRAGWTCHGRLRISREKNSWLPRILSDLALDRASAYKFAAYRGDLFPQDYDTPLASVVGVMASGCGGLLVPPTERKHVAKTVAFAEEQALRLARKETRTTGMRGT